jgi:hypothetical protein
MCFFGLLCSNALVIDGLVDYIILWRALMPMHVPARDMFSTNKFKLRFIDAIKPHEPVTLYRCDFMSHHVISHHTTSSYCMSRLGSFVDLCRGPHLPNTRYIKAFKVDKVCWHACIHTRTMAHFLTFYRTDALMYVGCCGSLWRHQGRLAAACVWTQLPFTDTHGGIRAYGMMRSHVMSCHVMRHRHERGCGQSGP